MTNKNLVTMAQAAEMLEMKRPTFYRKAKKLSLSTEKDSITGKKMVDVSELMRVFGSNLKLKTDSQNSLSNVSTDKKKNIQSDVLNTPQDNDIIKLKDELKSEYFDVLKKQYESEITYLRGALEKAQDGHNDTVKLLQDHSSNNDGVGNFQKQLIEITNQVTQQNEELKAVQEKSETLESEKQNNQKAIRVYQFTFIVFILGMLMTIVLLSGQTFMSPLTK